MSLKWTWTNISMPIAKGEFTGKVAFITGAAHGQGRAVALALAGEGARIVGFDVARQMKHPGYTLGSMAELNSLAVEAKNAGSDALVFQGDVRDDIAITSAVTETKKRFGRIDILFNNAGICFYGKSQELSEEEWDTMLDINLKGAWLVARRIIPIMIEQKSGVIINNASIASFR